MEKNLCFSSCPIRKSSEILGGRWTLLILNSLKENKKRFWEIKKEIPDVSEKVLIDKLKILEEKWFIKRKDYKTIPPKVEYSLLELWEESLAIIPILANVGSKL